MTVRARERGGERKGDRAVWVGKRKDGKQTRSSLQRELRTVRPRNGQRTAWEGPAERRQKIGGRAPGRERGDQT